jgi:hypothetical protein
MGQASGFELRHPWLIHNGLLLASVLTYWIDREDVVWRFIKAAPHARPLEHLSFGAAAVLIALGIRLSSLAAHRDFESRRNEATGWGGVFYAAGIGTLLPLFGFLLFVIGGFVRIARFESARSQRSVSPRDLLEGRKPMPPDPRRPSTFRWKSVLVHQAAACCAFLSMAVFSITLADRQAEYLFAATALVSVLFHFLSPRQEQWLVTSDQ